MGGARKIYGQGQLTPCACCGRQATAKTDAGIPACARHRRENLALTCTCGSSLEVRDGKWGTYFLCRSCGPVSYKKGLEMNGLPLPGVEDL